MLETPTVKWEPSDLQYLIDNEVEESERLDYKQAMPLGSEEKNCEAAKDVSALANTAGGRLIVGLVEHETRGMDVPVEYAPIADVGVLQSRLLDVLHSRCSPSVAPQFKSIKVPDGHCLVIDVPESLAPVMVTGRREFTYYHRVDRKSFPMTEREVGERYERMHAKRNVIDQMVEEAQPMPRWELGEGQSPWLTILTVPAFGPVDLFNPAAFRVSGFSQYMPNSRAQLAGQLPTPRPTHSGLESLNGTRGAPEFLLRLHRSGVVEYHHAVRDANLGVHSPEGINFVNSTGLRVSAGAEGVAMLDFHELAENLYRGTAYASALHIRGEYVGFGGWWPDSGGLHGITTPRPHHMDTSVDRLSADRFDFVRGLLDRVWQSAGANECGHKFDPSWTPGG